MIYCIIISVRELTKEIKMDYKDFLKEVTKWASNLSRDALCDGWYEDRKLDFDDLYDKFISDINGAVCEGIEDGMERWNSERPKTEQEIAEDMADFNYDREMGN